MNQELLDTKRLIPCALMPHRYNGSENGVKMDKILGVLCGIGILIGYTLIGYVFTLLCCCYGRGAEGNAKFKKNGEIGDEEFGIIFLWPIFVLIVIMIGPPILFHKLIFRLFFKPKSNRTLGELYREKSEK